MPKWGISDTPCGSAGVVMVNDLWGKRRPVLLCPSCVTFVRGRQALVVRVTK